MVFPQKKMQHLSLAPYLQFSNLQFVLTDMDETLTYQGRLSATTYAALEQLQANGIKVIPVTAASAGWCDQMARMWPVNGVIAENGGLYIMREPNSHDVTRKYWHSIDIRNDTQRRLLEVSKIVEREVPEAKQSDDQAFRLTSLAYKRTGTSLDERIVRSLTAAGTNATINNLWVLGWIGEYDKLSMSKRVLSDTFGVNLKALIDVVAYSGDSINDASMFSFFKHTVGVSTVVNCLPQLPKPPTWITSGPGGAGFVEFVDVILNRHRNSIRF